MSFILSTHIPIEASKKKLIYSNEVTHGSLKWKIVTRLLKESAEKGPHVEAHVECLPVVPGTPFDTRAQFVFNNTSRMSFTQTFNSTNPLRQTFFFKTDELLKPSGVGYNITASVAICPPTQWAGPPMSQPVRQQTAQPMSQPMSQPTSQPTSQLMNQPTSQPTSQPMSFPVRDPPLPPMGQLMRPLPSQPMSHAPTIQKLDGVPSIVLSRIEALEKDVASLKQEKEKYADRCVKFEETVQKLDGRLQATNAKVALIEKPAEKAPELNLEQKHTVAQLHSQIYLLTAALTQANKKIAGSEEALQKKEEERKILFQTIARLEGQVAKIKISETTLNKKLEESNESEAKLQKKVEYLTKEYQELDKNYQEEFNRWSEALKNRGAELIDVMSKLETQQEMSKKEFDEMEAKWKEQVESMKKDLEEKDAKIIDLSRHKDEFDARKAATAVYLSSQREARNRFEQSKLFYAKKNQNLEAQIGKVEDIDINEKQKPQQSATPSAEKTVPKVNKPTALESSTPTNASTVAQQQQQQHQQLLATVSLIATAGGSQSQSAVAARLLTAFSKKEDAIMFQNLLNAGVGVNEIIVMNSLPKDTKIPFKHRDTNKMLPECDYPTIKDLSTWIRCHPEYTAAFGEIALAPSSTHHQAPSSSASAKPSAPPTL